MPDERGEPVYSEPRPFRTGKVVPSQKGDVLEVVAETLSNESEHGILGWA